MTVHEESYQDGPRKVTVRTRIRQDHRFTDDWAYFHLRSDAPEWALDAMFRELSKRYHPDVTGDEGELQRILNTTYRTLKETFTDPTAGSTASTNPRS